MRIFYGFLTKSLNRFGNKMTIFHGKNYMSVNKLPTFIRDVEAIVDLFAKAS